MGSKDLRSWLETLEAEGELKRIKAEVDWEGEIGAILRRLSAERGPAVLFENIKGHKDTWSRRLFTNGLVSRQRIAMMFGMPKDTPWPDLTKLLRKKFKEPVRPEIVTTGPVKENIIRGEEVAKDGIMGIGRSKAKLFVKGKQDKKFADVGGMDEAKKELEEIVDFLKHPKKYTFATEKIGAE